MFIKNGQFCKGKSSLPVQVVQVLPKGLQVNSIELGLRCNLVYEGSLMVCPDVVQPTGPINMKHGRHKQNGQ